MSIATVYRPVRTTSERAIKPLMIWGRIPLVSKISTQATGGGHFVFEHTRMAKGGPPRHIHHAQDEWFYVVEGEFAMEIGDERHHLRRGDALFAPRGIPHAWACTSNTPGTLLTTVSPAGTFEAFILETTEHDTLPSPDDVAAAFERHGMNVVGPPLKVE